MPKQRTYRVTLLPTEPYEHDGKRMGWTTKISLGGDLTHVDVACTTFDQLRAHAADLFATTGWDYAHAVYHVLDGGRKPNGFDAWRRTDAAQYFTRAEVTS